MTTISTQLVNSGINSPKIMRNLRLALFRRTAFPMDLPVISPTREFSAVPSAHIMTTSGWAYDFPESLTRLKSFVLVIQYLRFKHYLACSSIIQEDDDKRARFTSEFF